MLFLKQSWVLASVCLCSWYSKFYSPEHVTHRRLVRPVFRDDRSELLAPQNRTQNRMTESQALHILQKHHNKVRDDNKNLKLENAKIKVSIMTNFLQISSNKALGWTLSILEMYFRKNSVQEKKNGNSKQSSWKTNKKEIAFGLSLQLLW